MNNGRWSAEEEEYVRQHVGKHTLEEMASKVSRSPLAVQLFIHRRQIFKGELVKRNLIQEILYEKFKHPENFRPNRHFYDSVRINQMRWWDIYFGRKPLTEEEYLAISDYFGITLQEAFEARQLRLFEDNTQLL